LSTTQTYVGIDLSLSTPQTYFGIDYGTRKIGVAVGQTLTRTAMGIAIVPVRSNEVEWETLDKLVQQWKPGAFVVGMPFNMDGTENDMTVRVRHFVKLLTERYGKTCHAELIGKRYNDKTKVDALAAQLMLETWLTGV
jgi:putative holliday junction resolvase